MNKTFTISALTLISSIAFAAPATDVRCTGCVGSTDIKDNGVTSTDIKNGTILSTDLSVNARLPVISDANKLQVGTTVRVGVNSDVLLNKGKKLYILTVDKAGFVDNLNNRWYRDSLNGQYPEHPTFYFKNTICDGQAYGHFGVNIESYQVSTSLVTDSFVVNGVVYPVNYNLFLDEGVPASRLVWNPVTGDYSACEEFTPVGIFYLLEREVLEGSQTPTQAPLFDTNALFTPPFTLTR